MPQVKQWLAGGLFAIFLILLLPVAAHAGSHVAVADFSHSGRSHDGRLGQVIADIVTEELVRAGYPVMERAKLHRLLSEYRLSLSGLTDERQAAAAGRLLRVNYLLLGDVAEAGARFFTQGETREIHIQITLTVRLVDVRTGRITAAESASGSARWAGMSETGEVKGELTLLSPVYTPAARIAARNLVEKLVMTQPSEGLVAGVRGSTVYLTLGVEQGTAVGQKFLIYREGQVVRHPQTGEVIGVEAEELATVLIRRVTAKMAEAEYDGPGQGLVKTGDKVRRVTEKEGRVALK